MAGPSDWHLEDDTPHSPEPIANWTESYAFWAWDFSQELSVFFHFQRHVDEPSIWRALCCIMVEDTVYVTHSYGDQKDLEGPGHSGINAVCQSPRREWLLSVTGAMHVRQVAQLDRGALTDGPAIPINLKLSLRCETPPWVVRHGDQQNELASVQSAHYEQTGTIVGTISLGQLVFHLNCPGANDHSHGARDFAALPAEAYYFICVLPNGRALTVTGSDATSSGYLLDGDGIIRPIKKVSGMPASAAAGAGKRYSFIVETDERVVNVDFETTRRRLPLTMVPPSFEHVGLVEGEATPRYYYEWTCQVWLDGEAGVGSWEPVTNRLAK
jgi:hypothetical protein